MPRQPDAPSRLARRWAVTGAGLGATLVSVTVALIVLGPELPVPEIQWPGGGGPHESEAPSHHHHTTRDGNGRPDAAPPAPGPTVTPSASISGSASPSPAPGGPGMLGVSPLTIHFKSREKFSALLLSANGGPVTWTAAASTPQLTLSVANGQLHAKGRVKITVALNRGLLTLPGTATVTVTDSAGHGIPVTISWDTSLL